MPSFGRRPIKWRTPDLATTGTGTDKSVRSCRAAPTNWARFNPREPTSQNTGTNPWTINSGFKGPTIPFNRGESPAMGAFTMGFPRILLVLGICQTAWTQSPTYRLGRAPSAEEIRAWDIAISPTGKELPSGQGTAKEGAALYVRKGCAGCHGATGSGAHAPTLISRKGPRTPSSTPTPCLTPCVSDSNTMGVHAPFATTIWDYIN